MKYIAWIWQHHYMRRFPAVLSCQPYLQPLQRAQLLNISPRHYSTMTQSEQSPPDMATTQPKLSAADFAVYNRMAEGMDYFHSHFRTTWRMLYAAASSGKRPAGMSIRQFIASAERFCHQLTMHHSIEEQHIFPVSRFVIKGRPPNSD